MTQAAEVPMGNTEKCCAFLMAWKHFCYISEVSGLIHPAVCHSQPTLSHNRQTRTIVQTVKWQCVLHANAFNLNCLHSRLFLHLAVALHARFHGLAEAHVSMDIQPS